MKTLVRVVGYWEGGWERDEDPGSGSGCGREGRRRVKTLVRVVGERREGGRGMKTLVRVVGMGWGIGIGMKTLVRVVEGLGLGSGLGQGSVTGRSPG